MEVDVIVGDTIVNLIRDMNTETHIYPNAINRLVSGPHWYFVSMYGQNIRVELVNV